MSKKFETLYCSECGDERKLTKSSAYEAKRLNKTLCRSCAGSQRKGRKSKYDGKFSVGMSFGKYTVISDEIERNGSLVTVKCECGDVYRIRASRLLNGRSTGCRSCNTGKGSSNWKGVGDMPSTVYTIIKLRAKRRDKEFNLSKKYLWELYKKQSGKCALSNMNIDFESDSNLSKNKGTASLDRIDSNIGYIEGNVQWVHYKVNIMKNEYSMDEFIKMCKLITEQNRND